MTEHLPECWCRGCTHPHVCGRCRNCICDELRACEQRVNSSNLTMWNHTQEEAQHMINAGLGIAWKDGFKEGLDAAREAVAAVDVRKDTSYEMRMQALAVIEALREKP